MMDMEYEYCPRCDANLTLQKGYRRELPVWRCLGCGEVLFNPELETESNVGWFCDGCGELMNGQPGFSEEYDEWTCTKCGRVNKLTEDEIYASEDAYLSEAGDPFKGLSDEALLELSTYEEVGEIPDKENVFFVRRREDGGLFVMKFLTRYDLEIYKSVKEQPIAHVPKIISMHEGSNCLIVIEEYVNGRTLEECLEEGPLSEWEAIRVTKALCAILADMHGRNPAIIHRDVKPSNVIMTEEGEIWLLDLDAAKYHDPGQTDDTRYLGTQYYAAPEQVGYGFSASSPKTDIYAVGMLLNVMLTGKFPKEEKAGGKIWDVIERCISLEAEKRYDVKELIEALERAKT